MMESMASAIQSLNQRVDLMATSGSNSETQGKLPSQTETNPRQNVSAITLRSGKELQDARFEEEKQVAQEPAQEPIDSEASPTQSEEPSAQRQASEQSPA